MAGATGAVKITNEKGMAAVAKVKVRIRYFYGRHGTGGRGLGAERGPGVATTASAP